MPRAARRVEPQQRSAGRRYLLDLPVGIQIVNRKSMRRGLFDDINPRQFIRVERAGERTRLVVRYTSFDGLA